MWCFTFRETHAFYLIQWYLFCLCKLTLDSPCFFHPSGDYSSSDVHGCSGKHFQLGDQLSFNLCSGAGSRVSGSNLSCLLTVDGFCRVWYGIRAHKALQIKTRQTSITLEEESKDERVVSWWRGYGRKTGSENSVHFVSRRGDLFFVLTQSAVHCSLLFLSLFRERGRERGQDSDRSASGPSWTNILVIRLLSSQVSLPGSSFSLLFCPTQSRASWQRSVRPVTSPACKNLSAERRGRITAARLWTSVRPSVEHRNKSRFFFFLFAEDQQSLTACLRSSSACCCSATSDGRSSTSRHGEVRSSQNSNRPSWVYGLMGGLLWNLLQAGPRTVCRTGTPTWSWPSPVSSWSALSGGSGRWEASLQVRGERQTEKCFRHFRRHQMTHIISLWQRTA